MTNLVKEPIKVIIDCDPGVDDVIAILLALSSPEILIVAISLTHGNTTLSNCLINISKLFYALENHLKISPSSALRFPGIDPVLRSSYGLGRIKVFKGFEGPIEGDSVTAKYFHGNDGLSDITSRHPDLTPPSSDNGGWKSNYYELIEGGSSEILINLLGNFPIKSISYLALGPVTSLAHLHKSTSSTPNSPSESRESILNSFSQILIMGGAVDVPGNTSPVSEFNTFADPYASSILYSLSLPHLYLFPLDITTQHTLPFPLYTTRVDPTFKDTKSPSQPTEGKLPLVHFTSSFLEQTREVMSRFGEPDGLELHDPMVVWAVIEWTQFGVKERVEGSEGGKGWEWQRREFEVETTGTLTRGMLVSDRRSQTKVSPTQIPTILSSGKSSSSNRAKAIEEFEARNEELMLSSSSSGPGVGGGGGKGEGEEFKGCKVVVGTSGQEKLREDLFKRIWGV